MSPLPSLTNTHTYIYIYICILEASLLFFSRALLFPAAVEKAPAYEAVFALFFFLCSGFSSFFFVLFCTFCLSLFKLTITVGTLLLFCTCVVNFHSFLLYFILYVTSFFLHLFIWRVEYLFHHCGVSFPMSHLQLLRKLCFLSTQLYFFGEETE